MIQGLVSTIVLNWNGKDVIGACLESLTRQTYQPHEIIVVDNGSRDGSLEWVRDHFGLHVTLIKNKENLGFAEGVNVGLKAARGEFIALLNSDASADPKWIEQLVAGIRRSETTGMCASKALLRGQDRLLDNTGEVITRDGLGRGRGRLEKDQGQYDREESVLCPSGCAALYRRKMLDEIGLFDQHFFAYADDIDVGLRGRLLGYECQYIPSAIVHHGFSGSFGHVSSLKAYYVERNRIWVVLKCFPIRYLLPSFFYSMVRYGYHFLGLFTHRGPAARYAEKCSAFGLPLIVLKAYLSTLLFLPYLICQRILLRKKSRFNSKDFGFWLDRYGMGVREAALNELA